MQILEKFFESLPKLAEPQPSVYYLKIIAFSIFFFAFWQAFVDIACNYWIATFKEKPRDVQIEHRSYIASLIHSSIVCAASFYAMFYAW